MLLKGHTQIEGARNKNKRFCSKKNYTLNSKEGNELINAV